MGLVAVSLNARPRFSGALAALGQYFAAYAGAQAVPEGSPNGSWIPQSPVTAPRFLNPHLRGRRWWR
jgi:hypothetical protein